MAKKLPEIPKERLVRSLAAMYARAAREIVRVLQDIDPATYSALSGAVALGKIRAIVSILDSDAAAWVNRAIKSAYAEGKTFARVRLTAIGAKPPRRGPGYDPEASHDRAIGRATKRTVKDLLKANQTILRTAQKYLALLSISKDGLDRLPPGQVQAFSTADVESWIKRTIAKATAEHLARSAVSSKIKSKLLSIITDGDFINVNGKNYNLKKYSELVAQTRMRKAQTDATVEMCKEFENDLVQYSTEAESSEDDPCEICQQYQGQVYSLSGNHPKYPKIPDEAYPPTHPRCLLPGTKVESPSGFIAGYRAWFRGNAIELVFSGGTRVSVTPNHMFLTPRGFAAAQLLRKGDDVFYCPAFEGIASRHPNKDHRPSLVEDVFGALAESRGMFTGSVPAAPEHLHGDGRFCNGDIDIVRPDGLLGDAFDSDIGKHGDKSFFGWADAGLVSLSAGRDFTSHFKRLALAADGCMGGLRVSHPFFLRRLGHADQRSLNAISQPDALLPEIPNDGSVSNPQGAPDCACRLSGEVSPDHFGAVNVAPKCPRSSQPSGRLPALVSRMKLQLSANRFRVHANTLRDFPDKHPGIVQLQKIVKVNVFPFSGHVYDLQTFT